MRHENAKSGILRPLAVLTLLACLAALAAPLAAQDLNPVGLGVTPAEPYDSDSLTLHFRVTLGLCYTYRGVQRSGNSFDLRFGGCPIQPPPGPQQVFPLDQRVGPLTPGTYRMRVLSDGVELGTQTFTVRAAKGTCQPGPTALCLGDRRFRAEVGWQIDDREGVGLVAGTTRDTGRFWFFQPSNVELTVKVLDGCATNGRFWIFAGGMTNVGTTLTVTDTTTGVSRTYQNPAGVPFQPIQDTAAFACP